MFPIAEITGGTLDSTIMYLAVIGGLLLVATLLRLYVPFFKRFYMPSALIAGVIGLILGPNFIGLIPKELNTMYSALAGRLILFVYAPLLMRKSNLDKKQATKMVGTRVTFCYLNCFMQYAFPLALCLLIFTPLWGINPLFGTIVEQGWAGGHGTSGGMAAIFEQFGWMDGATLSITSATVGLIFGIVGGTVLINIAVRKGWTNYITKVESKKDSKANEEINSTESAPIAAKLTVSPNVIDSFSFHLALMSLAIFIGWFINKAFYKWTGISLSWFVCAMFVGWGIKALLKPTKLYDAIDNATITRIQGIALDFLITGAVASVNIPVVISYALPLIIQQLLMYGIVLFLFLWVAPRIWDKDWFEHSIATYGTYTGVTAVGYLLYRMVDPELKCNDYEISAGATPFCNWSIGGGLISTMTPSFIMKYGATPVCLAYVGGVIVCFIVLRVFFWHPSATKAVKTN